MGNGSYKDRTPGGPTHAPRNTSIPTAQTDAPGDDLLTDPRMEFESGLQPIPPQITDVPTHPESPLPPETFDDPTVTAGDRFETQAAPLVSVPVDEARRLAHEGLAVVDPASYHGAGQDEATAALMLPPSPPPRPKMPDPATEMGPPPRAFHSDVSTSADEPPPRPATRSERAQAPLVRGISEAEARTARPEPADAPLEDSEALPGFIDPSVAIPPPASRPYSHEPSEPKSLPGAPVQDAPAFVVDEDTFGPNEALPPQTQLAFGSYRVDQLIGEGHLTRVYRATDLRTDQTVALKEFRDPGDALKLAPLRNLLERFREGQPPPAVLEHEGSIGLLDFIDDTMRGPVVVMEYVPAGDLESFLAHRGRPLSPREAAKLFIRVCETLAHALDHGVVHGDIQPRNILLTEDARPKIDLITPVITGQPVARPEADFAAPEVRAGGAAGPGADVYGLGASLYQASTDPRVAAQGGEAPGRLEPIIARCVEDSVDHRYATVRELADALGGVLDNRPAPPPKAPGMSNLTKLGIALAAVAIGLTIGVIVTASDPAPSAPEPVAPALTQISDSLMADARALEEAGQTLEAAAAFKRLMDANPQLTEATQAYATLTATAPYKKALRSLRRRLRRASMDDEATLRADLELIGVLAPGDALIDHWRSRLNQSNDNSAAGGPDE